MVIIYIPTLSHCQKAIKKLNNIIIARLMTNRQPNILNNTLRFDTFTNWKILEKEFKTWSADPLSNAILITIGMHVANLGYLEDGSPYFIELPDSNMKKSNRMLVGLDTAAIIPETDDQDLSDLID